MKLHSDDLRAILAALNPGIRPDTDDAERAVSGADALLAALRRAPIRTCSEIDETALAPHTIKTLERNLIERGAIKERARIIKLLCNAVGCGGAPVAAVKWPISCEAVPLEDSELRPLLEPKP